MVVNGEPLGFSVNPRMHNGHIIAPVRDFVSQTGGRLWYDRNNRWWHADCNNVDFRFREGSQLAYFGNDRYDLDDEPFIYGGLLYVALDILAARSGLVSTWDYGSPAYPVQPIYPRSGYAPGAPILQGGYPYGAAVAVNPYIEQPLALTTAQAYLQGIGQYPVTVGNPKCYWAHAQANGYWDATVAGQPWIDGAPTQPCWVVQYNFEGGRQWVYVDAVTGEVIGGTQSWCPGGYSC